MACDCELCKAPRRTLDEAEKLADEVLDDAQKLLLPGELFDMTFAFEIVQDNVKTDPVYALALLNILCKRHSFIKGPGYVQEGSK